MRRLDTPGCYRGVWWLLFGLLALPCLAVGCFVVQDRRMENHVHRAEAAFGRELERERLVGASRARVLAFLRRTGLDKTISAEGDPQDQEAESKPLEQRSVFRVDTPGAYWPSDLFGGWTSQVEFRFDRHDRLAGYRFVHRGGMIL